MPTRKSTKQIEAGPLYRSAVLDARALDSDKRTVELAFSSEEPVERFFGNEILDHDPGSVRLGRLRNQGPVLVDHDPRDHVGVVESVDVGSDRKARATVRFGKSARADEILQDVADGIRTKVSVGYRIHRMLREAVDGDDETLRVTDWEPYEISIVSVPADDTVGLGRSAGADAQPVTIEYEDVAMPEDKRKAEQQIPADPKPAPKIDVTAERDAAAADERKRVGDILALAREHKQHELADDMIREGRSVADFRYVVERIAKQAPGTRDQRPLSQLDLSEKDAQRYSLIKAIRAHLNKDWSRAGFELECSRAIADQLKRDARGFFVPFDVQVRLMSVADDAKGGYIVPTDQGAFIDNLRATSVVASLGATMIPGLVGDVTFPKKTSSATAYWLGEDDDQTASDVGLGQILMSPRTIGLAVPMTRKLLQQSSPAVEQMVRDDITLGAALGLDSAAIQGTGASGQPLGILNTANVNTVTVSSAGNPTWAEAVKFETEVNADNALMGSLAYLTTPAVKGAMKVKAKDSGSGRFVWEGDTVNGYTAATSTQVPTAKIIFGNWSDVLIGMWGVMDLKADEATKAASGGLVLRVFQDVDVALRHPESMAIPA